MAPHQARAARKVDAIESRGTSQKGAKARRDVAKLLVLLYGASQARTLLGGLATRSDLGILRMLSRLSSNCNAASNSHALGSTTCGPPPRGCPTCCVTNDGSGSVPTSWHCRAGHYRSTHRRGTWPQECANPCSRFGGGRLRAEVTRGSSTRAGDFGPWLP